MTYYALRIFKVIISGTNNHYFCLKSIGTDLYICSFIIISKTFSTDFTWIIVNKEFFDGFNVQEDTSDFSEKYVMN